MISQKFLSSNVLRPDTVSLRRIVQAKDLPHILFNYHMKVLSLIQFDKFTVATTAWSRNTDSLES